MDFGDAHYDPKSELLCQLNNWCNTIRVINFDKIKLVMIHNPLNLISSMKMRFRGNISLLSVSSTHMLPGFHYGLTLLIRCSL